MKIKKKERGEKKLGKMLTISACGLYQGNIVSPSPFGSFPDLNGVERGCPEVGWLEIDLRVPAED